MTPAQAGAATDIPVSAGDALRRLVDHALALDVRDEPFRWASADDPRDGWWSALADQFPIEGLVRLERGSGEKRYVNESRTVLDERSGADLTAKLPALWRHFVAGLRDEAYRTLLGRRVGIDLRGSPMELRLVRHTAGGYLSPHTDRADKLATQLWYFSHLRWPRTWGGRLRILASADETAVHATVAPTTGRSVVLVRAEDSWHSVEPVTDRSPRPRLSLLAHFHAEQRA